MPMDKEAFLNDAPKPKRNRSNERAQADDLNRETISSLAGAGVNTINAQVYALDARLNQFERETATVLADRMRETPLRIQAYLAQELQQEPISMPSMEAMIGDFFEPIYLAMPEFVSSPFAGQLPGV